MNCANVRRLLSAYCDAELPSQGRTAMRQHLHNCEGCTAALEAFKKLSTLTATWGNVQPSAALWQALAPKLMAARAGVSEAAAEEAAALPDLNQKRAGAKRSFKPVIEGLEDRYPLSDLLVAAGATIACSVVEPALAFFRADGIWAAMSDTSAAVTGRAGDARVASDFGNAEIGGDLGAMDGGFMWAIA